MGSMQERADESARLLEWSLRNFENKKLFEKGQTILQADVVLGVKDTLSLKVDENIVMTMPTGKAASMSVTAEYDSPIIAPIKEGDKIGTLKVNIPEAGEMSYPLLAAESINEPDLFTKTLAKMKLFFKQNL
jgi:D-alanyl-D-alanine carboxypeptidase (penicillin-binding protein 5/6)